MLSLALHSELSITFTDQVATQQVVDGFIDGSSSPTSAAAAAFAAAFLNKDAVFRFRALVRVV